jgi:hypothetical protein
MSKKVFLDAFFNQFGDFLDQLVKVIPDDTDLPAYKATLGLLQRTNPTLVIKETFTHMSPFEAVIRARNEDFFLKHEFAEYDTLEQLITKIKSLWVGLSENNKNCVWGYLTILLDISKRFSEMS